MGRVTCVLGGLVFMILTFEITCSQEVFKLRTNGLLTEMGVGSREKCALPEETVH